MTPPTPTQPASINSEARPATAFVTFTGSDLPSDFWAARGLLGEELRSTVPQPNPDPEFTTIHIDDRPIPNPTDHLSTREDRLRSSLLEPKPGISPAEDSRQAERVRVRERWEGYVHEVADSYFTVRITPAGTDNPALLVDLAMSLVDAGDLEMVQAGAHLYLNIGYLPLSSTTRFSARVVRFSRLPRWRPSDLERFVQIGREMRASLPLDNVD